MNILNIGSLAIALCGAGLSLATYAAPATAYKKTIDPNTVTWEQIDPKVRKINIIAAADVMEAMLDPQHAEKIQDPIQLTILIAEISAAVDYSELTGEYKAYHEALIPIQQKILSGLKELKPIPPPKSINEFGSYQTQIMEAIQSVRKKYQPDIDEINRQYPNAAILLDTSPGNEPVLLRLMEQELDINNRILHESIKTRNRQQTVKNVAAELRRMAEAQK